MIHDQFLPKPLNPSPSHSLFAERVEDPPVLVVHSKPLAVPWTYVDVDGAEVVVLLVAGGPGPRHFHVQLHGVHAQDGVPNVGQEVGLWTGHLWGGEGWSVKR